MGYRFRSDGSNGNELPSMNEEGFNEIGFNDLTGIRATPPIYTQIPAPSLTVDLMAPSIDVIQT